MQKYLKIIGALIAGVVVVAALALTASQAASLNTHSAMTDSESVVSRVITGPMELNSGKTTRITAIWAGLNAQCPTTMAGNGGGYNPPTVANLNIGGTLHAGTVAGGSNFPLINGVVDLVVPVPAGDHAFIVPITAACSPLFVSAIES